MIIVRHEWRQGRTSFLIWTACIGLLLSACVFLFPEMKGEMENIGEMFASMGSFTAAFGMDRLNFGTLTGFYALECGNVLGLGGAFYASLTAANMISKEEKDKTAEFLLAHPVSRTRILAEKLAALLLQITALNLTVYAISLVSISMIGETIPWKEINLLHFANYLMQLELSGICFGLSGYLRRGTAGAGLGLAAMMYGIHLMANIARAAEPLKYITPFAYCDGARIVSEGTVDPAMLIIGLCLGIAGIAAAFLHYNRKDIL